MSRAARIWIGVAVIYGLMSVVSFGHSAAHHRCYVGDRDICQDGRAVSGMSAALLWPLYWSWELQS